MPSLTPRTTDFVESAPARVTTIATVEATPDEVWAVLIDNERLPEWFPAAKECRTTSEQGEGVGSTRWIHFDLFKVNEQFIAWDPPHQWAFTILDANLPGIVSVVERGLIEPEAAGVTKITYTIAAEVAGIVKPLVPALKWRLGSLFATGLQGIEGQVDRLREEPA